MARKLLALLFLTAVADGVPVRLRSDFRENPLGIDTAAPQLSWHLSAGFLGTPFLPFHRLEPWPHRRGLPVVAQRYLSLLGLHAL